jgi:hypothetical protein
VIAAACILMSHIFMQKKEFPIKELEQNWFHEIDEELTLEAIVEAKNEIKKVYAKDTSFRVDSIASKSTLASDAYS